MPDNMPSDDIYDRVAIVDLDQILPQQNNANAHTQRGMGMLDRSITEDGWSGAGEMAANNEIYHGSARREVIEPLFNANSEGKAIVLSHDGTMPIFLKRTDIPNAQDPRAVRLGVKHNRIAEVNLSWNVPTLVEYNDDGIVDLDDYWLPHEQQNLFDNSDPDLDELTELAQDAVGEKPEYTKKGYKGTHVITIMASDALHERWESAVEACDRNSPEAVLDMLLEMSGH